MRRVEVPSRSASLRAMARPTTPAPITYPGPSTFMIGDIVKIDEPTTCVKSALETDEVENGRKNRSGDVTISKRKLHRYISEL